MNDPPMTFTVNKKASPVNEDLCMYKMAMMMIMMMTMMLTAFH